MNVPRFARAAALLLAAVPLAACGKSSEPKPQAAESVPAKASPAPAEAEKNLAATFAGHWVTADGRPFDLKLDTARGGSHLVGTSVGQFSTVTYSCEVTSATEMSCTGIGVNSQTNERYHGTYESSRDENSLSTTWSVTYEDRPGPNRGKTYKGTSAHTRG